MLLDGTGNMCVILDLILKISEHREFRASFSCHSILSRKSPRKEIFSPQPEYAILQLQILSLQFIQIKSHISRVLITGTFPARRE